MNVMKSLMRAGLLCLVAVTISGCSSPGGGEGYVTKTMSDRSYMKATPSVRKGYLKAVAEEAAVMQEKKEAEYQSGRPVTFGDSKTGYTLMWDRLHNVAYFYPGHHTSHFGIDQEAILSLATDQYGNILYQNTPGGIQPVRLLANVATQEGMGRVWAKIGGQVATGMFTNTGAALMNKLVPSVDCKDGGCGGDSTVNILSQQQAATAGAAVDVAIQNPPTTCTTCDILKH